MSFSSRITFLTVHARFHLTVAMCEVIEGGVGKGDTVRFLDADRQLLATGTVSAINLDRKAVKSVVKGDEPLTVGLEFRDVSDDGVSAAVYMEA